MMIQRLFLALVLSALFLIGSVAQASVIRWTLDSVTFSGGGAATGWFDYDTGTALPTDWDVDVTASGVWSAFNFTPATSIATPLTIPLFSFTLSAGGGGPDFFLDFHNSLAVPDSNNPLVLLGELENRHSFRSESGPGAQLVAGGFASAPVPVPAAAWLFGSALGLLGWMRRRKAT